MRTQNTSQWLFRVFAALAIVALSFSQFSAVAQAKETKMPGKERVKITLPNLNEVVTYYGKLEALKGPIGIVVELADKPAAVVFAESKGNARSVEMTQQQISTITDKQASFASAVQSAGIQTSELFRAQKSYNGIWMRVDPKDLKALAAMPGVKAIHPMVAKTIDNTTSVPLLGAPTVWGGLGNVQGQGVKIGIIDTGIDYQHTNFGGSGTYPAQRTFPTVKVVGGWDFVGDAYNANDASPIIAPDADPMDCNGHGSHVAGTAAGYGVKTDGSTYIESGLDTYAGLRTLSQTAYINKFRIGPGVAPKADLYGLRVFGCAGSTNVVVQALDWAMDPNGDGNLMDHLDVVNMSLGSPFGGINDVDAVASDNVAKAGVVVVASAGNENDVYYVTGSPAVSQYAISVASSVDAGAVMGGFEVTGNTAVSPVVALGKYPASDSIGAFGPSTYHLTGDLAQFSATDLGCNAYAPDTFAGKVALINRGTCTFVVKVKNAQNAGATGVLLANNVDTFPAGMGGADASINIPAMMTIKSIGASLRTDMGTGTVTVLLTSDYRNTVVMTDPTVVDTVSSFSSRGPARGGTLLKPDISAPGDSIFSTANGSGNQGASFNGTSMAAPHMSGVMALLKQIHPTWSVPELKALAMNTATNDLWTNAAHTQKYSDTRVGAGRASVYNAALSPVIAYNTDNPELVSLSFGEKAILGTQTFVKSITLKNTGVVPADYLASFVQNYQVNDGISFTLMDANDVGLDHPITIPANGTVEIKVKITADAPLMTRARDGSISNVGTYGYRDRISEAGGYVVLNSYYATVNPLSRGYESNHPTLRVPVHIAARPASDMSVEQAAIKLPPAATGTLSLTPTGTPVDTVDDTSLVSILELMDTSPQDPAVTGNTSDADLQYVGAMSDYPVYTFADSSMYFGISTYGKWETSNTVEFDIYIDVNEDGVYDYVVFNYNEGLFTGTTDDVMFTSYCELPAWNNCNSDYYTNYFNPSGANTNLFNNNVMLLPVGLASIGLTDTNTDFNFYVKSYNYAEPFFGLVDTSNVMHYDVAHPAFNSTDAVDTGVPMWLDAQAWSPTFDIGYDSTVIASTNSKGLLLLHHHNQAASTAEVVPLAPATSDGIGVFRPSDGNMYLKTSLTSGVADLAFNYGTGGDYPVTGDWTASGTDTIGIYRNGSFYLRNSNSSGVADSVFAFGAAGDQPIAGDWNGDGIDTIGTFRNGMFYLRNSNDAGAADVSFALGLPGDVAIAGDWNGDGIDTVGVFRPSNGALYLKDTNTSGVADLALYYGLPGDKPVTGDWDNNGTDTIGVFRNGTFYLRNSNTTGVADFTVNLGTATDMPLAGDWGLPQP